MYPKPHLLIASAVFSGSWGSRGGGVREVFTAQKRHPRVHVSPINYNGSDPELAGNIGLNAYHDSGRCFAPILRLSCARTPAPTIANIWTSSLFTNGVKFQPTKVFLNLGVGTTCRDGCFQEGRQSRSGTIVSHGATWKLRV